MRRSKLDIQLAHYKLFFEKSPDAMLIVVEGKIIECNQSALKMFGFSSKEECLGLRPFQLSPERQPNGKRSCEMDKDMMKVAMEKDSHIFEWVHKRKNGEKFFSEIALVAIPIDNKIVLSASIRDITVRKEAQSLIEVSEKKFREVFNNANDAIFLSELDTNGTTGNFIEVNDYACKMLGFGKEELLEMSSKELDIRGIDVHNIDKKIIEKKFDTFETVILSKLGDKIPVEISSHIFEFFDKNAMLSIARDISDRKWAEKYIKLFNEAKEYDKLKTLFISNISHELRTPLNLILGIVQLLEWKFENNTIVDEENKFNRHLKVLRQNSYRLIRLVNNMIDITKMESGYIKLNLHNDDIVRVIENITLSVAEYIEHENIDLRFDTSVEEKIIACDPDKIERIILNLLSNAVKFTPVGGSIFVSINEEGEDVLISVKDTGIGIPKDKLDLIFERFRQADKSYTRNHEGSGIGLSIVKALVKMHDGSISVKSEPNQGSEFVIKLPIRLLDEEIKFTPVIGMEKNNVERISIEFSDIYS